jgi:hypothetical protein
MTTLTLADRVDELVAQHGSLRAVGRVLSVDHAWLWRLRAGDKVYQPGVALLRRMGLRKIVTVTYVPLGKGSH